jgi:uncharacterized protein (TIGR03000 family)
MKRLALALFAAGLAIMVVATPAEAQWRGGGWRGGGWGGWRGGWDGGWYGGLGYGYGSPYYGGYYGSYYRPYYGGYYSPYAYGSYTPYYGTMYGYSTVPYTGYSYGQPQITYNVTGMASAGAPQTQTYQSFYSPPSSNDRLSLRILVPAADARVWVDNTLTDRQGTDRSFVSPQLTPGQQYSYTVRASWMENGREVTRQKVLSFTPGQQLTINFGDRNDPSITDVTAAEGTRPATLDRNAAPGTSTPAGADRRLDQSQTGKPGDQTPPPTPPK